MVARLEDAHRRLVIPAVIPTAGRNGDMTIAVRQEIARAVIVLTGIDHPAIAHPAVAHPAVAHQLSVIRTTALRTTALRTTAFLAIAAPLRGPSAIARRVIVTPQHARRLIVIRTSAFPKTVLLETGPLVVGLRVIVRTDAVTAVTVSAHAPMARGTSRDRTPMDVVMIVLSASPVALMRMASVPMNAVMTRVRAPQLQVDSVRIDRPRVAFVIVLSERPIDTVLAMRVVSRHNGSALATLVLDPSGPSNNPRPKLRRRPQTI